MKQPPKKKKDPAPFSKFYKKKPPKEAAWEEPSYYAEEEKKTSSKKKNKDKAPSKTSKKQASTVPKSKKGTSKKEKKNPSVAAPVEENMRLNKYIAHAGICSRRKASEHIQKGLVMVNDVVITEMGYKVQAEDTVKFQGEIVTPTRNHVYLLLNKPKNVITTLQDEKDRKTVLDFVGELTQERIYPVGRLDRNTTGLLLFTNDGDLAKKLLHPSSKIQKLYKVRLDKPITQNIFNEILEGTTLEDGIMEVDEMDRAFFP